MSRRPQFRFTRARIVLIALAVILLVSVSTVTAFYTDLLWFKDVGFDSVFWGILRSKLLLAVSLGTVFFVFCAGNLALTWRRQGPMVIGPRDPIEQLRRTIGPFLRRLALVASVVLAVLFAIGAIPLWDTFTLARNGGSFGTADPVFGRDVGFYVFRLPALRFIYSWALSAVTVVGLITAGAYLINGAIRLVRGGERLTAHAKAHLSLLVGLFALVRAWGYRLDQFDLLYSTRGSVIGASYTDVNAELPALRLLVIISIIAAVLFVVNIRFRGWTFPIAGLGLWLLTSVIAAGLFPLLVQRFRVAPAELQRETPFIDRNIKMTRAGYGLDRMKVQTYPAKTTVTQTDVAQNQISIDNLRLWDTDTLKQAYKPHEITLYYEFLDVDVDRYVIDGRPRQLMLSARELDYKNLESKTWQNEHVIFTHGYGAAVSTTHESVGEGEPRFLVKDIPPTTNIDELRVDQGGIYFGETDWRYSIVNTEAQELDYPIEEGARNVKYTGSAGIPISNPLRRVAFALRLRDVNLLLSGLIKSDSKVLIYRNVRDRLRKIAPFLEFDGDPYLVIHKGRLVWIVDGFTTSAYYPYSSRTDLSQRTLLRGLGGPSVRGVTNYIRNSVKATIDAYDGTVSLYKWDEDDPVIEAWSQAFPSLLKPRSQMPPGILAHVRYPEDLFRVQSFVYRRYHVQDPASFYQSDDIWVIPDAPGAGEFGGLDRELQPYYVLMKLPGESRAEYVLILPMNPPRRPNMVSLLAAKSDPAEFGDLLDLRFPRGIQIDGVGQVFSRINQNPKISQTRTLLGREGSEVIFGNLLVIPLGESILYSQPFFVRASENPIPELKHVILASSERVVMEPSLEEALQSLLRGGPSAPDRQPGRTVAAAIQEALVHFRAADAALREGDLVRYAREIAAARRALESSAPRGSR